MLILLVAYVVDWYVVVVLIVIMVFAVVVKWVNTNFFLKNYFSLVKKEKRYIQP